MSLNIMVVDDRPELLVSIRAMLEPMGSEVMTFADSREAAERVKVQKFDAVFVDVQMPHLDGFELTSLIRSSEKNAKVPIIMLTDVDDIQTMRLAFKAGATYFIGKPVSVERVQNLFNAVLGPVLMLRRKNARLPFLTRVNCTSGPTGEKQFDARSLNISVSGMAIDCSADIAVGQSLTVEFALPSVDRPLRLSAKVQRAMPPKQFGLVFVDISVFDQEAIQSFIFPAAAPCMVGGPGDKVPSEQPAVRAAQPRSVFKPVAYVTCGLLVLYLIYGFVVQLRTRAADSNLEPAQALPMDCETQSTPPALPLQHSDASEDSRFISLDPAVIHTQSIPEQEATYTLTLDNQSGQELTFMMAAEDMVELQGKLVHLAAGELANGIAAKILFSSPALRVPSGRKGLVTVTLPKPLNSVVSSVLIALKGTDKIRSWRGRILQASPATLITLAAPPTAKEHEAANIPAISTDLSQSSAMSYSVCKWRGP